MWVTVKDERENKTKDKQRGLALTADDGGRDVNSAGASVLVDVRTGGDGVDSKWHSLPWERTSHVRQLRSPRPPQNAHLRFFSLKLHRNDIIAPGVAQRHESQVSACTAFAEEAAQTTKGVSK